MNCTGHFAARAGLEVGTNGGFLVNRCMLASDGVYLSGEVANVRMSVGRGIYTGVDHAYHTGIVAGRNMAGIFDTYDHIPIYEASAEESDIHLTFVGHCSAAFETHGFWWKLGGSNSTSTSTPTSTSSSAPSTSSSSSSSSSVTSASSTKKDTKNGSQGLYESINQPSRTSAGSGSGSGSGSVPKQQTMGERITSDFFEFFGYKPIILQAINTKILNLNPMGKLNVKKITEENSTASLVKIKSPPPLGIGILFYIDNDIVVGILISGSPLSQQGINPHKKSDKKSIGQGCDKSICGCKISSKKCDDKKINETGTVETCNENLQSISYSEKMHERARSFIGKPLSEVVANIEAEIPEDGISVTDFRSGRLIRLQNLSEIAGYIVAPAVLTSVDEINSSLKPNYKKIAVQLPKPNYRYASSSRTIINAYASNIQTETLSFAPTIMQENVFSVGGDLTGTRADKLAAAYASGLRYGIEGPGSR